MRGTRTLEALSRRLLGRHFSTEIVPLFSPSYDFLGDVHVPIETPRPDVILFESHAYVRDPHGWYVQTPTAHVEPRP